MVLTTKPHKIIYRMQLPWQIKINNKTYHYLDDSTDLDVIKHEASKIHGVYTAIKHFENKDGSRTHALYISVKEK